jgi:hypothetical protein
MSFSRSKGSIISAFFAVSLILAGEWSSGLARDREGGSGDVRRNPPVGDFTQEGATLDIMVALVGITAFQDSQEIRAGLLKTEGVKKVAVDTEAPGFITYRVTYTGEAMSLIDKLSNFFPKKYDFREKRLPSGGTEVDVSRKGFAG